MKNSKRERERERERERVGWTERGSEWIRAVSTAPSGMHPRAKQLGFNGKFPERMHASVHRPLGLFRNKEKQARRQLKSTKQNNMHYS